jgi:hypothetical protein
MGYEHTGCDSIAGIDMAHPNCKLSELLAVICLLVDACEELLVALG